MDYRDNGLWLGLGVRYSPSDALLSVTPNVVMEDCQFADQGFDLRNVL